MERRASDDLRVHAIVEQQAFRERNEAESQRDAALAEVEKLRDAVRMWRNWSDEVVPPWGRGGDRSDDGQRTLISQRMTALVGQDGSLSESLAAVGFERDSALARLAFVEGQRNLLHTEMESIRFLANKALGDSMFAVPPAMTAPDVARCTVCRWPLAESMEQGCVPGNCSYRPRTKGTPDHG
jgi:hypothetical protein